MGTFYSKDGPIQTEKDYDVVKRVPEGQVVYNSKFPNLVFYQNQVLPMRNGVIVNYQDSDWVMESYQNFINKYHPQQTAQQEIIDESQTSETTEKIKEKLIETIQEIDGSMDVEDRIILHTSFSDPDIKNLEKKYGFYISDKKELILKDDVNFQQLKNLFTLLIKHEIYTNQKGTFIGEDSLSKEELGRMAAKAILKLINFGNMDVSKLIGGLLIGMYDKNIEFDEMDIQLSELIFKKGNEYYSLHGTPYFFIDLNRHNYSIEDASNLMKFVTFYFKNSLGGEKSYIYDMEPILHALPAAIFGNDLIKLLLSERREIEKFIEDFISSNKLHFAIQYALEEYIVNNYDEVELINTLYKNISIELDKKISKLSFIDEYADETNDPMFSAVKGVLSIYFSRFILSLLEDINIFEELKSSSLNDGASIILNKLKKFHSENDSDLFLESFSPSEENVMQAKVLLGILNGEHIDDKKIKDILRSEEINTMKRKLGEGNYGKYLEDLNTMLLSLSRGDYSLGLHKKITEELSSYTYASNPAIFFAIHFVLSHLNNRSIYSGVDKEFLRKVMPMIIDHFDKLKGATTSSRNIFLPEINLDEISTDKFLQQLESLLETESKDFDDPEIKEMSKDLIDIIMSTNDKNALSNSNKINEIFKKMLKKLEESKEDLKKFTIVANFISDTVKMFEDLYHPQYDAHIGYILMKQNLNILNLKKELYEQLVDFEKYDYALAASLQESLLQRIDSFLYDYNYGNFSDLHSKNKTLRLERINFINENKLKAINALKEAIEQLKDGDLTEEDELFLGMYNQGIKEIAKYMDYMVKFIDSEYKTEPIYKFNEAFYRMLDAVNNLSNLSTGFKLRRNLIRIGGKILSAKFLLSDILMESNSNSNFTVSISSGSPSHHISGHIFFMKLVKDLEKYREFAFNFTNNAPDRSFTILTISKYNQKRIPILKISLQHDNNLYIDFASTVYYPYTSPGKDNNFSLSEKVIERVSPMFSAINPNFYGRVNILVENNKIPRPQIAGAKHQRISLGSLKDIFWGVPKTLDDLSYAESMAYSFPLIVSNEKFLGPIRPFMDNLYHYKDRNNVDAINTINSIIMSMRNNIDLYLLISSHSGRTQEWKRELDENIGSSILKDFSVDAFDHFFDDQNGSFKETFGDIIKAEYKKTYTDTTSNNYQIEITTRSKRGEEKKLIIIPSFIRIDSFKRISYKYINKLFEEYANKKEKLGLGSDELEQIKGKIIKFKNFLREIETSNYISSIGMLESILDKLVYTGEDYQDFGNFLAEQLILEGSLGISPVFFYDENGISFSPYIPKSNNLESTFHFEMFPLYTLGNISSRFMYKISRLSKKIVEKTTDEKFSKILENVSKEGSIKMVPGIFRSFYRRGEHIFHDVLDSLRKFGISTNLLGVSTEFDLLEKELEYGEISKKQRLSTETEISNTEDQSNDYPKNILDENINEYIGSLKTILFHELGHKLDYLAGYNERKKFYKSISPTIKKYIGKLKEDIELSSLGKSKKHTIIDLVDAYINRVINGDINIIDYSIYEKFREFFSDLSVDVKEKNEFIKILSKYVDSGVLLNTYALFNGNEIPSTVLEFASVLGEEEFRKRFKEYETVLDYLLSVAKSRGYL
jgi:hypothetical protein